MHQKLLSLSLLALASCHAQRAAAPPPIPETIEVIEPEHGTRTRDPFRPRYVRPERAVVSPPDATPCVEQTSPSEPVAGPDGVLDDAQVQAEFDRERAAAENPPSVHCHFYTSNMAAHLGIRAGQRTSLRLGTFVIDLSFAMDVYEGSRLLLEVYARERSVIRYGKTLWLGHMPRACGAPGFSGWQNADDLRAFCTAAAAPAMPASVHPLP